MLDRLIELGKEPSTWRGLVAILTSLGIAINAEQAHAIIVVGLFVAGAIGVSTRDKK